MCIMLGSPSQQVGPEVILDLQLVLTLCYWELLPSLQPAHTETRRLSYRPAHRWESIHAEQQEPVVMSASVFLPYRGAVDREAIQRGPPPPTGSRPRCRAADPTWPTSKP